VRSNCVGCGNRLPGEGWTLILHLERDLEFHGFECARRWLAVNPTPEHAKVLAEIEQFESDNK
jgi:hypothetical protein